MLNKFLSLLVISGAIMFCVLGTDGVFFSKHGIGNIIFEGLIGYGIGIPAFFVGILLWNYKK